MGLSTTALTAIKAFTASLFPPQAGSTVLAADVEAGEQVLLNRTEYLFDKVDQARVVLSDADHTLDLADGWRYQLPENPAAMRTISMPAAPSYNAIIEIIWPKAIGNASAIRYEIRKGAGGSNLIAQLSLPSASGLAPTMALVVHYDVAQATYRLGMNSGQSAIGVGVISGGGA